MGFERPIEIHNINSVDALNKVLENIKGE